jgi:hypothetical protein
MLSLIAPAAAAAKFSPFTKFAEKILNKRWQQICEHQLNVLWAQGAMARRFYKIRRLLSLTKMRANYSKEVKAFEV